MPDITKCLKCKHDTIPRIVLFTTTHGWDAPILDDRAAPHYPRHQPVSETERALTDAHLARIGASRIRLGAQ